MKEQAITIDLIDGTVVPHRSVIKGKAFGGGCIQTLVLSADGRWYTQRRVFETDGNNWGCVIVLGYDQFTHPNYYVAAGIGGPRLLEPSYSQLPCGTLWTIAAVNRESKGKLTSVPAPK